MTYLIRKAAIPDMETLWRWRNDPVTRRMARTHGVVEWPHYRDWFHRVAARGDHLLLVAEHSGKLIAYASFAPFAEPGRWTISLTLGPEHRARGHGTALIPRFLKEAIRRLPVQEIVAHIRTRNTPSHKAFKRAGFEHCGAEGGIHRYRFPVRRAGDAATMDQSSGSPLLRGRDAHPPST